MTRWTRPIAAANPKDAAGTQTPTASSYRQWPG